MLAGKLKHRISLQSATTAKNTFGEDVQTWATYATVWAEVTPLNGRELLYAQQASSETSYRVSIRYNSSVAPTNRLVWGSKTLEVTAVINVGADNRELELMCREIN